MGKYEKKRAKKSRKGLIVAIVLVVTMLLLVLFLMPQVLYRLNSDSDTAETFGVSTTEPQNTDAGETTALALEFPYSHETGKLEVESLFQFDGINPDCGKQKGDHIAALNLKNVSGDYLSSANITVVLNDSTELRFAVCDLPAGKTAMAFSLDNQVLPADAVCADIQINADFAEGKSDDRLSVTVEGTSIMIENMADTEINNIVVYYRDVCNEDYFGGVAYSFEIENLSAGESMTFTAGDSLLGMIEVVRIAVNDQN